MLTRAARLKNVPVIFSAVRYEVVDAVQLGFRPMVVAEGVGDRSQASHQQSLFDIDTKYGDVVGVAKAEAHLSSLAV